MPVRIKYNHLPAVIRAIPKKERQAIARTAYDIINALKGAVWHRWGYIAASVKDHSQDPFHADIWIGEIGHTGFYSGFQEFGTVKQAPRPVVGPVAHMHEPVLVKHTTEALREAARAR